MAIGDFLLQGQPIPQTSSGASTTSSPQWVTDYSKRVLESAAAVGAQQYQPYSGQRIAKPSTTLKQAWQTGLDNAGLWEAPMQQGMQTLQGATGASASGAAQPMIDQSLQTGQNAVSMSQGAFGQASPMIQGAYGQASPMIQGAYGQAMPMIQNGLQQGTGTIQNGYQQGAGMMGAAGNMTVPQGIGAYMNPYQDAVVNRIAEMGNRNLSEKLLPAAGDTFIRAGQFGSSRHMGEIGKALRDTQEGISAAQSNALASGYTTAGQMMQNDLARQLQAGQGIATAGTQAGSALSQAGTQAGSALSQAGTQAGSALSQAGTQAGSALSQAGNNVGQTMNQTAQNQGQLAQLAGNMQTADVGNAVNLGGAFSNLGRAEQTAGLTEAAAQEAIGQQKTANSQKNLDLAYSDFVGQRDYPQTQTSWMANIANGLPSQGTSTTSNYASQGTNFAPSGLSQIAGALSLSGAFGRARGGKIPMKGGVPRRRVGALKYAEAC